MELEIILWSQRITILSLLAYFGMSWIGISLFFRAHKLKRLRTNLIIDHPGSLPTWLSLTTPVGLQIVGESFWIGLWDSEMALYSQPLFNQACSLKSLISYLHSMGVITVHGEWKLLTHKYTKELPKTVDFQTVLLVKCKIGSCGCL